MNDLIKIESLKEIGLNEVLINGTYSFFSGIKNIYKVLTFFEVSAVLIPPAYKDSHDLHDRGLYFMTNEGLKMVAFLGRKYHDLNQE